MNQAPYEVIFTATARRGLQRAPEKIATACVEFITGELAANPHRMGKRLFAPLDGQHSARRGTYRVLYEIDDAAREVWIRSIEHRANAYRSR